MNVKMPENEKELKITEDYIKFFKKQLKECEDTRDATPDYNLKFFQEVHCNGIKGIITTLQESVDLYYKQQAKT